MIHLVFESLLVIAFSSSSKAPGVFLSFLTKARMAFSHDLLWFEIKLLDCTLGQLLFESCEPNGEYDRISELDDEFDGGGDDMFVSFSIAGFTLKPSSFLTIAGVIHRLEKCAVNIDMGYLVRGIRKQKKNFILQSLI